MIDALRVCYWEMWLQERWEMLRWSGYLTGERTEERRGGGAVCARTEQEWELPQLSLRWEWSMRVLSSWKPETDWKLTDSAGRDFRRCSATATVCLTWVGYGYVGERPGTLALSSYCGSGIYHMRKWQWRHLVLLLWSLYMHWLATVYVPHTLVGLGHLLQ